MSESGAIEQDAHLVALLYKLTGDKDERTRPCLEQHAAFVNLLITRPATARLAPFAFRFLRALTRFEGAAKISADDLPE